jgi:penicillin amidase
VDLTSQEVLKKLGSGEHIESVCAAAGITMQGFEGWWKEESASRLPDMDGHRQVQVEGEVEILRDEWGIPHIFAGGDDDLFFGYVFAMGQDRLWQLDYLLRATG